MNHLETLAVEWFEYNDYIVKKNTKVGPRPNGGWEGELDIVAYHPQSKHFIHIEASMGVESWAEREKKFAKKFKLGRKYIPQIFPWIRAKKILDQWAIIPASNINHDTIGGGKVVPLKDFIKEITDSVRERGHVLESAIPEHFPLLRTIQFAIDWGGV
jgi:hypothetical protein